VSEKADDKHIRLSQVRYLAFEGGGGKGFAFVGALKALESSELQLLRTSAQAGQSRAWAPKHLQGIDPSRRLVVDRIKGVSGASAGAITALLVSCGYNSDEILKIMTGFDFTTLFEPPTPRFVPKIFIPGIDPSRPSDDPRAAIIKDVPLTEIAIDYVRVAKEFFLKLSPLIGLILTPGTDIDIAALIEKLLADAIEKDKLPQRVLLLMPPTLTLWIILIYYILYTKLTDQKPLAPISMLVKSLNTYMAFLWEDMGLFAGVEARKFLAEVIAFKMPPGKDGRPRYNATFQEHWDYFGVKFVVTGTNLETGKSGWFSQSTTPNMAVADAVRISMGLPMAYKPVVIRQADHGGALEPWVNGVWVDGGYLNNIPLQVFDLEEGPNPKTFGIRLEVESQPPEVANVFDFICKWPFYYGFFGAGEAQVTEAAQNLQNAMVLATEGLSLFRFDPDPKDRDEAIDRALNATWSYFRQS
jgi:predicted acylesterase/phospholipase RssA